MTLCDGWSRLSRQPHLRSSIFSLCATHRVSVYKTESEWTWGFLSLCVCVIRTGPVKLINQTETSRDTRETLIYAERQRDQACRVTLIWPAPSLSSPSKGFYKNPRTMLTYSILDKENLKTFFPSLFSKIKRGKRENCPALFLASRIGSDWPSAGNIQMEKVQGHRMRCVEANSILWK